MTRTLPVVAASRMAASSLGTPAEMDWVPVGLVRPVHGHNPAG